MFFKIENGRLIEVEPGNIDLSGYEKYFGFLDYSESLGAAESFGFGGNHAVECAGTRTMLYENSEGYDFMSLDIRGSYDSDEPVGKVHIYLKENFILFLLENAPGAEKILLRFSEPGGFPGFDRLLNNFFERLIAEDCGEIDSIEQEIADLEDALLESRGGSFVKEIAALRKRLLVLKRYYEQLLNVLDELLENENSLLSETSLRYFKIFDGKADRRYRTILNLRDYVTQVREAYQAEVDIGLNNIMKIFTVLTAVFLPLTLLVGWYGMNLKMPEFGWEYGYPMVICLSVLIVGACFLYFKKKKWF